MTIAKTNLGAVSIMLVEGPSDRRTLVVDSLFVPVGSHVSVADLSTVYTVAVDETATKVVVQALVQNVRFTVDGTAPTASTGFQITAGDPPFAIPAMGATLKFIEETAGAKLELQQGY